MTRVDKGGSLRSWLREPLLHFAVGGALLFALYAALNPAATGSDARQIRIGAGEVKWLASTWRGQTGREPTPDRARLHLAHLVHTVEMT